MALRAPNLPSRKVGDGENSAETRMSCKGYSPVPNKRGSPLANFDKLAWRSPFIWTYITKRGPW